MRRYYLKPRPRSDDPPIWFFLVCVLLVAGAVVVLEGHGAPRLVRLPVYVVLGGLSAWTIVECIWRWRKRRRES